MITSREIFISAFKEHKGVIPVLWITLFLLTCLFLRGIFFYQSVNEGKYDFQKNEKIKVEQYKRYSMYGGYGFRLLFLPTGFAVLNGSDIEIAASINIAERLTIFKNLKSKHQFKDKTGFMNVTGILIILACLGALILGFETTNRKSFLFFFSEYNGAKKTFFIRCLARLSAYFLIILSALSVFFVWAFFAGINLFDGYLLVYILMVLLLVSFCFFLGTYLGTWGKKKLILLLCIFFIAKFFIPWVVDEFGFLESSNIESSEGVETNGIKISYEF